MSETKEVVVEAVPVAPPEPPAPVNAPLPPTVPVVEEEKEAPRREPTTEDEKSIMKEVFSEGDPTQLTFKRVLKTMAEKLVKSGKYSNYDDALKHVMSRKAEFKRTFMNLVTEAPEPPEAEERNGEDDYDEEEKKKKNKKEKKRQRKEEKKERKRKSKRQREETSEEQDAKSSSVTEEQSGKRSKQEDDPFSQMLSRMKTRHKKNEIPMDQLDKEAYDFVAKMGNAADDDLQCLTDGKPALNKLRFLNEVRNHLVREDLKESLIKFGVLEALAKWLKPLPDGTLPNILIRTTILQVLKQLPIDPNTNLNSGGVAAMVLALSNSKQETPENRTIARELVDNWSRRMFDLSASYKDLSGAIQQQLQQGEINPVRRESGSGNVWVGDKKRAHIPSKDAMDFLIQPKSEPTVEVRESMAHRLQKQFLQHNKTKH